jgi:DNA-binding NarL/FixJ family response regulator
LVVDDHSFTRAAVASLLNREPGVRVCGRAGSVRMALAAVKRTRPDLVLTDLEMGDRSGLELVRKLHAERPELPVLVFSMHYGSIYADRVLRAGANGYVMKSEGPDRLLEAVRAALAGRAVGRVRRKGADRKLRAAAACPAESARPRSTPQ